MRLPVGVSVWGVLVGEVKLGVSDACDIVGVTLIVKVTNSVPETVCVTVGNVPVSVCE